MTSPATVPPRRAPDPPAGPVAPSAQTFRNLERKTGITGATRFPVQDRRGRPRGEFIGAGGWMRLFTTFGFSVTLKEREADITVRARPAGGGRHEIQMKER